MVKKILVIMATFNGEKYLTEQLESIFNQEKVAVSVLVRDDGSKDKTCEILNSYQAQNKLQWYTGKHLNVKKGYFDLMKKAADYDVDYVAFSDQDDVWDSDKMFIAVQFLDRLDSKKPALYYCGQRLVNENLNFISNHTLNRQRTMVTRFVLSDFAGCTGVFNTELLHEVIKYEPEYMLMHDTWILKVCLCLGGQVLIDPDSHMNYRQHSKNTVGLGRSIPAYLKQVNQYLNEYHVELQMAELIKGYGDRMVPEYKKLANDICQYRENPYLKIKLLNKKYINFYSIGLNITYDIKVILNKL